VSLWVNWDTVDLKVKLKRILENLTGIQFFKNSLPRGVDVARDICRIYSKDLYEIWDIGAHKGETAAYFRTRFPKPVIRSFEPISENYQTLKQNCSSLPNHYVYNLALGDEIKSMIIHLQNASVIHSLRPDLNQPSGSNPRTENIKQTTVDSLFQKFNCQKIDILKIDVEGYEKSVLKGAEYCLENKLINFIYLETGLDDRFNSIQSIIDTLGPHGYSPYGFYEQTAHWTGTENLWYWNSLFVNKKLL
jgi:FkbM family methyltransferase